jgi:hypothetical protein
MLCAPSRLLCPRPGAILLRTTQAGFGLECLPMVVRPLGVDTDSWASVADAGRFPAFGATASKPNHGFLEINVELVGK